MAEREITLPCHSAHECLFLYRILHVRGAMRQRAIRLYLHMSSAMIEFDVMISPTAVSFAPRHVEKTVCVRAEGDGYTVGADRFQTAKEAWLNVWDSIE